MLKSLSIFLFIFFSFSPIYSQTLGLGREATTEEVAAWDIDVRPDGLGLPIGIGSVESGEEIYSEKCASCHGDFGEAVDRWPVLAGGLETLTNDRPVKTVGSYWPYLSTVWDYIHRAMPFGYSQSLTDDEVYSMVAYIMYLNDLVDEDFLLSNENFHEITMSNADGFFMDNRLEQELEMFTRDVCMNNCVPKVEITGRARILDVTPEETEPGEMAAMAKEPLVISETDAPNKELFANGVKVFKKCKACHKVGEKAKNGVGPHLNGVYGKLVASNLKFKYSNALKKASEQGMIWDQETLSAFLRNPKGYIKKTKMNYKGLKKEKDIKAVILYLKSFEE